jgi:hypothetical protein
MEPVSAIQPVQRDNYDGCLPTIKLAKLGSRRVKRATCLIVVLQYDTYAMHRTAPSVSERGREDTDCYGLKGKNLAVDAPHYPRSTPLTRREIEAIADYILTTFVGK